MDFSSGGGVRQLQATLMCARGGAAPQHCARGGGVAVVLPSDGALGGGGGNLPHIKAEHFSFRAKYGWLRGLF